MKICAIDGCNDIHHAKTFCKKHYMRLLTHGDPLRNDGVTHNMTKSIEYKTWEGMLARCYNPNITHYHRYGGRGITICDRWRHSFENFYEDMGSRPSKKYTIDRINNDGNYEPCNCRWVTRAINARNRSTTKLSQIEVNEIRTLHSKKTLQSDLAKMYKVRCDMISRIVNYKRWTPSHIVGAGR